MQGFEGLSKEQAVATFPLPHELKNDSIVAFWENFVKVDLHAARWVEPTSAANVLAHGRHRMG
jgi:hypothetical protein